MDFEDLVTALEPPPNRVGKLDGAHEHHLYEGAVMVAYAMHLLRTQGARDVRVHPDGEHGKQFDFTGWLERRGFDKVSNLGSTAYGGSIATLRARRSPSIRSPGSVMSSQMSATTSSRPNARAASSTRGIQARCLGSTAAFARRSEC